MPTKIGRRAKPPIKHMHHVMMDTAELAHLHRLMGGQNKYPPISDHSKSVIFKWFDKEIANPMADLHLSKGIGEL